MPETGSHSPQTRHLFRERLTGTTTTLSKAGNNAERLAGMHARGHSVGLISIGGAVLVPVLTCAVAMTSYMCTYRLVY